MSGWRGLIGGWAVALAGLLLVGSSFVALQCGGCPCSCSCVDFGEEYMKFAIGVFGMLMGMLIIWRSKSE